MNFVKLSLAFKSTKVDKDYIVIYL